MSSSEPIRVLFVCMGNICRSPAAEGVFTSIVNSRGLQDRFLIDSAGTIGYHSGSPADRRMSAAATKRGVPLTSRSRQVTKTDLTEFDWVIAMDRENLDYLKRLHSNPTSQIALLSRFLSADHWPIDVPDPYYGGDDGFEYVLNMLEAACPAFLDHLLSENGGTSAE